METGDTTRDATGALARSCAQLGRRWRWLLIGALLGGGIGGGSQIFRPPLYESAVVMQVHPRACLEAMARDFVEAVEKRTTDTPRAVIDRYARLFVQMTGARIYEKDQTLEQYLSTWQIDSLAHWVVSDAVLDRLIDRDHSLLRRAWPDRTRIDKAFIRKSVVRIRRDKPENVFEVVCVGHDPDAVRILANRLGQSAGEPICGDHDAPDIAQGLDVDSRADNHSPIVQRLQAASPGRKIGPYPVRALVYGAFGGLWAVLTLAILFPLKNERRSIS